MPSPHHDPSNNRSDLKASLQSLGSNEISKPETIHSAAETEQLLQKLGIDTQIYHELIKPRVEMRALNSKVFNIAFSRFVALIFYTNTVDHFLQILESVSARGIAETGIRKNKDTAIYHDAPHPAEVSKKVGILLSDYYNHDPESEAIMGLIFVKLAQAAAACHDIVQNHRSTDHPMMNEEKSAELCAKYIIEGIETKLQIAIGNAIDKADSDTVMKVIDDFKKMVPFITNELIVPTTYLVKPGNIPLAYYIQQFEEAGENHGD